MSNNESDWGIVDPEFTINSDPKNRFWIVDDFYDNPDQVREFALQQMYFDDEGYIGIRTRKQFLSDTIKSKFENIMGVPIKEWESHGMNGRFQLCKAGERLVYHCDDQKWAGVLYLTPDAPTQTGTSFYKHKKTGIKHKSDPNIMDVFNQHTFVDGTPYEMIDTVGNVFNRLIIFDAGLIHAATNYMGYDFHTGRLFQIFFFD
jgi:hypothetical protein